MSATSGGDGPVVVMLHGAPDNKDGWRGVIELLKSDFHCIALDLPGMGEFGEAPDGYDFRPRTQADWFENWRTSCLGETPFILLAHDIGAIMAASWATAYAPPDQRLLLSNTVLTADHEWQGITKVWANPILGPLFMATLIGPAFRYAFARDFPGVTSDQISSMYAGLTRTARRSLLQLYRVLTEPDYFDEVASDLAMLSVRTNLTVVWGQEDSLIDPTHADQIGGHLIRLQGCGHWVPLERPDVLAGLVRSSGD